MASTNEGLTAADYGSVLNDYLRDRSERSLLDASDLSLIFVESGLGPEDVIAVHFEALDAILQRMTYREQARVFTDAHQFLLEIMIAYGVRYKDYLELKLKQVIHDAESRAAQERERILEAERLQREGNEILETIAHELRTPLTTVKGNLDLASRSLSQGRVEPATRFVGTAQEAVDRLSRLTADLVEASRAKDPGLELAPLDLTTVVEQACNWARVTAVNKAVSLRCEAGDTRVRIVGSADALLSVFGNLLSNAIRYTPSGGSVICRLSLDGSVAVVVVEDTGMGMTPEVQARIFEKFYRAPAARRVEAQGLGLGLSLVQQMVAAHGGSVEVESEPGAGSTFRVSLPTGLPNEP